MDMVMDNGDMAEQADELYGQILGEIGMNLNSEINAGKGNIAQQEGESKLAAVSFPMLLSFSQKMAIFKRDLML